MLARLLQNHVMANLLFLMVMMMGISSYLQLPRQKDPEINFNWIEISTYWSGASASDVEKLITDPLEEAITNLADVRFVSSNSRENISSILVRFNDIDERTFDKRISDLRREVQNKKSELPSESQDPVITEITSANAFPSAMLVITAPQLDSNMRRQSALLVKELRRLKGVSTITTIGLPDPEIQVNLKPERLMELGVSATDVADTIALNFRDLSAGRTTEQGHSWLIRVQGTTADPSYLEQLPLMNHAGEIKLGQVAEVRVTHSKANTLASYDGQAAIFLGVTKKEKTNILDLLETINQFIEDRNQYSDQTGVTLLLADDQTVATRDAINIMQNNALIGLIFVLLTTWVFLGSSIAILVSIGIPFVLAATFWLLMAIGQTLNQSVLLGVVIALGMLVDDAVVIAEAIYYRLQRGIDYLSATIDSLKEMVAPVTAAVLTTIAAFLPLMLLPGILGEFMLVIPLVVTSALAISLLEAFWMLPAHIMGLGSRGHRSESVTQRYRSAMNQWIRIAYTRMLVRAVRRPIITLAVAGLSCTLAAGALSTGTIRMDFFASDPMRLFYVSVTMPPSSPLEASLQQAKKVQETVEQYLEEGEARAVVSYAGMMFSETAPLIGDHYGQVMVSLYPKDEQLRSVDKVINSMREAVLNVKGAESITFVRLSNGPPVEKPIKIKVRGDDYQQITEAAKQLKTILKDVPGVKDISDDAVAGRMELRVTLNQEAIRRAGLRPDSVRRTLALLVDGEKISSVQHQGEKWDLRVQTSPTDFVDIQQLLQMTIPIPKGGSIALEQLVHTEMTTGLGNILHYNFRRAITVEADIDNLLTNAVLANQQALEAWEQNFAVNYPDINLNTSGSLDDIQESLSEIAILFLLGLSLMYLILGTQFRSYLQPLVILVTIPLAFTGVTFGLLLSGNPLSLYTLYGVVALAGIAVNAAIVLISAANDRLESGMSPLHATLYAARRRIIPILITSLTTIAGLFSLATGIGGESLLWGPVATAIVWGLAFSTVLTMFVIPVIYLLMVRYQRRGHNTPL